ncbi:MAG: DNA helicase RecG, partial [Dehalococcoidia bacterium]|nr:DNA helicase RecG [Dehalococcoidia bacterium]
MSEAGDRLRRILQEEHRRGYTDSAVQGGLDTFLHHVAPATAADPALRTALAALPAQGYRALSPGQRQRWAESVVGDRPAAAHSPERAGPKRPIGRRVTTPTKRPPTQVRRVAAPPRPPLPAGAAALDAPIGALPGLRRDLAAKLEGLGAATVRDLLFFFPHRHADYAHTVHIAELRPNEEVTVIASVWSAGETRIGRRMKGAEAVVGDDSGTLRVVWFNQPWIARQLSTGQQIVLSGRVTAFRGRLVMESPEWEPVEADLTHTGRLVPVYSLTAGLAQRSVRRLVKGAVDTYTGYLSDPLPE